ncbi:MAG: DUF1232 domain-containing protein [Endomicrobium sp.]|jgi:uncharacterized membrane protein YkvA (DUF1232 family)|nr:DUF1232 domain-containing protein [Endomicrobium sp.]
MNNSKNEEAVEAQVVKEKKPKIRLAWIFLFLAAIYTVNPIDFVPDAPVIGWIDDFLIDCAAVLNLILKYRQNKTRGK